MGPLLTLKTGGRDGGRGEGSYKLDATVLVPGEGPFYVSPFTVKNRGIPTCPRPHYGPELNSTPIGMNH